MYDQASNRNKLSIKQRPLSQMPQSLETRNGNCSTGSAVSKIAVGTSSGQSGVGLTPSPRLTSSLISNLASHNGIPQSQFYNKHIGSKSSPAPVVVASAPTTSATVVTSLRSTQHAQGQQLQQLQRQPPQQATQANDSELQCPHRDDQQNILLNVRSKTLHNIKAPEVIDLSMDDAIHMRNSGQTYSEIITQDLQTNSAIDSLKKQATTQAPVSLQAPTLTPTITTVKRKSTPKRLSTNTDNIDTNDKSLNRIELTPMTGDKPSHQSNRANRGSGYHYANSISPSKLPLPRPLPPVTNQSSEHSNQQTTRPSVKPNAARASDTSSLNSRTASQSYASKVHLDESATKTIPKTSSPKNSAHKPQHFKANTSTIAPRDLPVQGPQKMTMQTPTSNTQTQPVAATLESDFMPADTPFTWDLYLKLMPAECAPREAFRQSEEKLKNNFTPGMKLQALDPRSSSWGLASVLLTDGPRMRLRFDGGDKQNDLFELVDSDKIKPVDQLSLMLPPMNYLYNMAQYHKFVETELTKPGVVVAPPEYFYEISDKPKKNSFRPGMKIEAMDKRNPSNIYPATVTQVDGDKVSYGFDGWPTVVYTCDYYSSQLFPVNWCRDNGHLIIPPEGWDLLVSEGIAIKLPIETSSMLTTGRESARGKRGTATPGSERKPPAKRNSKNHDKAKGTKKVKASETPADSPSILKKSQVGRSPDNSHLKCSKKQVLESSFEEDETHDEADKELDEKHSASPTLDEVNCKPEGFQCQRVVPVPDYFNAKKAAALNTGKIDKPVASWTVEDVKNFVSQDPSLVKHLKIFEEHEIDGKAFLLLKSDMMLTHLGLKMGPTLKIQDLVNEARRQM